jgi:hypothetical protein
MLYLGIVVSGPDYQEAAAWAAATYIRRLNSPDALTVFLPEGEVEAELLKEHSRAFGFRVKRFNFSKVSPNKFTSQLKCQGFHHAVSRLANGDVLFLVDADTYCLGPIELGARITPSPPDEGRRRGSGRGGADQLALLSVARSSRGERDARGEVVSVIELTEHNGSKSSRSASDSKRGKGTADQIPLSPTLSPFVPHGERESRSVDRILNSIHQGSIALVPDIQDRHDEETTPADPWYLVPQERLAYVNSGVIAAGSASLGLFEKFRELSEQPAFLRGPFNDQKVINFALGRHFRDRLALLDERFNYIHRPGQFQRPPEGTVIGHCAGGAGWISYANGYRKRAHQKICESILEGTSWPFSG